MNNIPCASRNIDAITWPADCCVFGSLGGLHRSLSIQPTAWWTLVCGGGSIFHSLLHIVARFRFYCGWTALNHQYGVAFVQLWAHAAPTEFSHAKIFMNNIWYTRCVDIFRVSAISLSCILQSTVNYFLNFFDVFWSNSSFSLISQMKCYIQI